MGRTTSPQPHTASPRHPNPFISLLRMVHDLHPLSLDRALTLHTHTPPLLYPFLTCPTPQGKRTKKVGITGKYGVRYGSSLRKVIKKIEVSEQSRRQAKAVSGTDHVYSVLHPRSCSASRWFVVCSWLASPWRRISSEVELCGVVNVNRPGSLARLRVPPPRPPPRRPLPPPPVVSFSFSCRSRVGRFCFCNGHGGSSVSICAETCGWLTVGTRSF